MRNQTTAGSANRYIVVAMTVMIVVFVIAVSYVFYREDGLIASKPTKQNIAVKDQTATAEIQQIYEKDTDGDGLYDWEEILWSTDPNKADTDGNGVTDSEEIFAKNDNTGLGLDHDALNNNSQNYSYLANNTSDETLTATDAVSRELFGSFLSSLQKDKKLSPREQEEMVNNALRSTMPLMRPPIYTDNEVHTVADTDRNINLYIKTVTKKVELMLTGAQNEYLSMAKLTQGDKEQAQKELEETAKHYAKYTSELKNINVPTNAVLIHVDMIQSLLAYIHMLEGFSVLQTDPMRTAMSAQTFSSTGYTLKLSFEVFYAYKITHENK